MPGLGTSPQTMSRRDIVRTRSTVSQFGNRRNAGFQPAPHDAYEFTLDSSQYSFSARYAIVEAAP